LQRDILGWPKRLRCQAIELPQRSNSDMVPASDAGSAACERAHAGRAGRRTASAARLPRRWPILIGAIRERERRSGADSS
jgi:hypothetical protein